MVPPAYKRRFKIRIPVCLWYWGWYYVPSIDDVRRGLFLGSSWVGIETRPARGMGRGCFEISFTCQFGWSPLFVDYVRKGPS